MDIQTNELNAPVIPTPVAPYVLSKYAKSYLDALKSGIDDVVSKSNAQAQVIKSYVESEVTRVEGLISAEESSRQSAISAEQTARQTAVTDLQGQLDVLSANQSGDNSALDTRISDLETWRTVNTDELSKEVDKAINEKVAQTTFDTIKAELEQADSQIAQNLSDAITSRTQKDAEHDTLLQRVEKYINLMLANQDVVDANGNTLTSFDDVLLVTPPVLVFTTEKINPTELYSGQVWSFNDKTNVKVVIGSSQVIDKFIIDDIEYPMVLTSTTLEAFHFEGDNGSITGRVFRSGDTLFGADLQFSTSVGLVFGYFYNALTLQV